MEVDLINQDGEVESIVYDSFMGFDNETTGCHLLLADSTALKDRGAINGLYILLGDKWHRISDEFILDRRK